MQTSELGGAACLLTAEEVAYLARDSGAEVLVTDKAAWATLKDRLGKEHSLRVVLLSGSGPVEPAPGLRVFDLDIEVAKIRTWR